MLPLHEEGYSNSSTVIVPLADETTCDVFKITMYVMSHTRENIFYLFMYDAV
jgi:hypothetical protein